ncbi:MAG: DUF4435 domain-containing protein [Chitinophagaceae bacterium]|nr:DUF4435 domain-containing protein [Chitinophagaceae bacterium]
MNGLSNQHLFHNVDLVVFVEGGNPSLTRQQILNGVYHHETEDIIFWRNIFNVFRKGQAIKFKSVGSKTTIKEIALDIINGDIQTIMVAMDNEFDEVLKLRHNHPNILYTHGYSFENDIWNSAVIKHIIEDLSGIHIANDLIERSFQSFLTSIKIAVYSDGYQFKKGSSFFPRSSGYMFCVNIVQNNLPSINKNAITNRLNAKNISRSKAGYFGRKSNIDAHKHCFGHFLSDYCCQIIMGFLRKRHGLVAPNKTVLSRMGIVKFFQYCFSSGAIFTHYQNALAPIPQKAA